MSITYKFSSLASMADYFENKAREMRASVRDAKPRSDLRVERTARAAELESVAHMIRHSEIGGDQ